MKTSVFYICTYILIFFIIFANSHALKKHFSIWKLPLAIPCNYFHFQKINGSFSLHFFVFFSLSLLFFAPIYHFFFLSSIRQLYIEFKPESSDGIILLTGERDDLSGDFLAVLIDQGHIEFW